MIQSIHQAESGAQLPLVHRRAFMKLPLQERHRILAEQADRMADHYKQDAEIQGLWGGDFVDCYGAWTPSDSSARLAACRPR